MLLLEQPFEIIPATHDTPALGHNGRVHVTCELPGEMFKRRSVSPTGGLPTEMLVVAVANGPKVYVRQLANGTVTVLVTTRNVYV